MSRPSPEKREWEGMARRLKVFNDLRIECGTLIVDPGFPNHLKD
jgi:hypothetical protein